MTAARFLAVVALLAFGTASPAAPKGGAWKREKARLAGVAVEQPTSAASAHAAGMMNLFIFSAFLLLVS